MPTFRLFILGAGFSIPAGLPSGPELLNKVRADVRAHFRYHGSWDGPLEDEIREWVSLYPGKELNLESVLGFSHRKHYLGVLGSKEYFAHSSRSIDQVRRSIQETLTQETPIETPELYREFAKQLRPTDVVLTFNYDTLLEQALDDVGTPFSLTPEWWLKNDADPAEISVRQPKYVDVIKLHGSIDWYDRHYHDTSRQYHESQGHSVSDDDPLFGPNASVPTESLARGPVRSDFGGDLLKRIARVPDHRSHYPLPPAKTTAVPFVLPPAYDKLLGHDPIVCLWENLHRTLDAYSVVTLIGYRMPMYDAYAYEILGRLLIDYQEGGDKSYFEHRRVPVQVVTLPDPGSQALDGIPFLKSSTKVWAKGFSLEALQWLDWGD